MSSPGLFCTPLHLVEFAHSIEQNVFCRRISVRSARQIHLDFERDRRAGLWREVGHPDPVFAVSVDLVRNYTATIGTRTLDLLHVASALALKAERFWTFDDRQAKLAKAVGLKVS